MKILLILFWSVVFTPFVFYLANLERGYSATGGEVFLPFLPILLYALYQSEKERNDVHD